MTRQTDIQAEVRETNRRDALVKALEYGFVGALENQGIELLGISIKYDAFSCLMTIRAERAGKGTCCFVGSDSIINCFLKAESDALRGALNWGPDKFHKNSI